MVQKLSKNENELYKRIDEVLHYIWDPIGVSYCPGARDEYYMYLPKIFQLAKEKESKEKIAEYLNSVQSERMGLPENIKKCEMVAGIILDWKDSLHQ